MVQGLGLLPVQGQVIQVIQGIFECFAPLKDGERVELMEHSILEVERVERPVVALDL